MSTSQFSPGPTPSGGSSGRTILVIILIVCGVLLLACAGICGGCALFVNRAATEVTAAMALTPVQNAALTAVREDQQVKDKLGEPMPEVFAYEREGSGELKPANENFSFKIEGPKGSAKVLCSATQVDGVWKLTAITVQTSDGATFNVPPPAATGPDVQFEMPDMPEETK